MLRALLTGVFVATLVGSCASAPAKPSDNGSGAAVAPAGAPSQAAKDVPQVARVLPIDPHGPLGRGRCVDCFDCVDTVGFPAPGFRWACVHGKCERNKLPGVGEANQPADAVSSGEPAQRGAKARRTGGATN
jgi:hypothetical protein